jgi:predicted RNA binding protein YcfA (HicA-like mRNA interferase family)
MKTPVLSGRDIVKALEALGFAFVHGKGSHMTFKKPGHPKHVTVYVTAEMPHGTLLRIIKQAGVTKEEFLRVLEEAK